MQALNAESKCRDSSQTFYILVPHVWTILTTEKSGPDTIAEPQYGWIVCLQEAYNMLSSHKYCILAILARSKLEMGKRREMTGRFNG